MYMSHANQGEQGPSSSFQINRNVITKRKNRNRYKNNHTRGREPLEFKLSRRKIHCSKYKTLKLQNKRQRRSSRKRCPELETRQLIVWHLGGLDRGLNSRAESRKSAPGDVIVCSWEPALACRPRFLKTERGPARPRDKKQTIIICLYI